MYFYKNVRIFDDLKASSFKQLSLVLLSAAFAVLLLSFIVMAANPTATVPLGKSSSVKSSSSSDLKTAPKIESGSAQKTRPVPIFKTVTTLPLTMTGLGNVTSTAMTPFTPKAASTVLLTMTGQGADVTASVPAEQFLPKITTTAKLTMTGQGNN